MKRTPRAGNNLSIYFPESIYSLPNRDKSFTTTQSTIPRRISSSIAWNAGRSKLEPKYPSSTRTETTSISFLSFRKSRIKAFWLEIQTGRLTQEAAYAIMGRIALFNQHWDEAINAYKNVVGKIQLFKSGEYSEPLKSEVAWLL